MSKEEKKIPKCQCGGGEVLPLHLASAYDSYVAMPRYRFSLCAVPETFACLECGAVQQRFNVEALRKMKQEADSWKDGVR